MVSVPTLPNSRSLIFVAAALLLTSGLAGCIGNEGSDSELPWSSYEEARDANGQVFEPNGTSTVRVKWLKPATPDTVPKKQSEIYLLVFDSESDDPITDAEIALASQMPAMGHGTASEKDPEHQDFGVYKGVINPTMGGQWILELTVGLPSGENLDFQIGYNVQGGDGMHGGHGGMGDNDTWNPSTDFGSYQEAKDAEGAIYEPNEEDTTTRLKLISPPDPTDVPQDHNNVTVLLFDEESDEPITDANLTLEAFMTAMGHGTSPEKDPVHTDHGVYKGMTTFSMEGKWRLDIGATLTDDSSLTWNIEVDVGNVSETWGSTGPSFAFQPYNATFEDDVQSTDYNESHAFNVKGANATIQVNFTLTESTTLIDELNLTVLDPDGEALASMTVGSDQAEATRTIKGAPSEGDYTARVTGTAVDAHYVVDIYITPPGWNA